MTKIEVVARTDAQDLSTISPDGTFIAHFGTGFGTSPEFNGKTLEIRETGSARQVAAIQLRSQAENGLQIKSIQYCDRGRYLLAFGPIVNVDYQKMTATSEDLIKILDMRSYQLHADIPLSAIEKSIPPQVLAKREGRVYKSGGQVLFAACAANAPIAVIFIGYEFDLGVIKVFNLDAGSEIPGTEDLPLQTAVEGIAISPMGSSIALIQKGYINDGNFDPGSFDDYGVTIIDLQTKRVARTIQVRSEYRPGIHPIQFAGESMVAVELLSAQPGTRTRSEQFLFDFRASVHFFDAGSGAEKQVIADPSVDDFVLWGMSADGRTMLAYTGKSRICESCNHGNGQEVVTDARFTMWNLDTGKPIAESPSLQVIHHTCPWYKFSVGACTSSDETPLLAISDSGNAVIASWSSGGEPIEVYGLRAH
jgi:hypothetical protein